MIEIFTRQTLKNYINRNHLIDLKNTFFFAIHSFVMLNSNIKKKNKFHLKMNVFFYFGNVPSYNEICYRAHKKGP